MEKSDSSIHGASALLQERSSVLTGVAGEYYVAAELSARGYIASITLRNTKGVDILCSSADASKSVGIQVKTNRKSTRAWMLNKKAEDYFADNLFYVLVTLNNRKRHPDFFVVPSKTVAKYVKEGHAAWLQSTSRSGQPHVDTPIRQFTDPQEEYLGRWDLLGL
jgi:hypothetical protein